jgi:hypothetical protein
MNLKFFVIVFLRDNKKSNMGKFHPVNIPSDAPFAKTNASMYNKTILFKLSKQYNYCALDMMFIDKKISCNTKFKPLASY